MIILWIKRLNFSFRGKIKVKFEFKITQEPHFDYLWEDENLKSKDFTWVSNIFYMPKILE